MPKLDRVVKSRHRSCHIALGKQVQASGVSAAAVPLSSQKNWRSARARRRAGNGVEISSGKPDLDGSGEQFRFE